MLQVGTMRVTFTALKEFNQKAPKEHLEPHFGGVFCYNTNMKRINSNTNKPFKYGDTRQDGFVFVQYFCYRVKKDGFFIEKWLSPSVFEYQKEGKRKSALKWDKENPGKACAKTAKRYSKKMQRTPVWDPNKHLIPAKYQLASMLSSASGIPHNVDHIIPLQGEKVSGLHVFSNLRVIPREENLKKSNNYEI